MKLIFQSFGRSLGVCCRGWAWDRPRSIYTGDIPMRSSPEAGVRGVRVVVCGCMEELPAGSD
jgi:hypothetical protein